MKATYIEANGDLDQLKTGELPDPSPKAGEAVIAIRAAALNHLDIWIRKGRPGMNLAMPHVLGSDAAGVVEAVGDGVTNVKAGDDVILNPGISCGHCEWCLRGEQSECPTFGIVGAGRPGTFAEKVAVPAANLQPKPAHLSWEEAAALPLAHLTAWRMLMSRAAMRPGESVLIHGIGGGVALAALQFAREAAGMTIVTSSDDDKLTRAVELGATYTINYKKSDVAEKVKEITNGRGVDIIIDSVGAATWPVNMGAVRRGGRVVHCGVTTGAEVSINLSQLYWNHVNVLGSTMGSNEEFRQMIQAVGNSRSKPVIDQAFPLAEARAAMGRMEEGAQFGKIVLRCS